MSGSLALTPALGGTQPGLVQSSAANPPPPPVPSQPSQPSWSRYADPQYFRRVPVNRSLANQLIGGVTVDCCCDDLRWFRVADEGVPDDAGLKGMGVLRLTLRIPPSPAIFLTSTQIVLDFAQDQGSGPTIYHSEPESLEGETHIKHQDKSRDVSLKVKAEGVETPGYTDHRGTQQDLPTSWTFSCMKQTSNAGVYNLVHLTWGAANKSNAQSFSSRPVVAAALLDEVPETRFAVFGRVEATAKRKTKLKNIFGNLKARSPEPRRTDLEVKLPDQKYGTKNQLRTEVWKEISLENGNKVPTRLPDSQTLQQAFAFNAQGADYGTLVPDNTGVSDPSASLQSGTATITTFTTITAAQPQQPRITSADQTTATLPATGQN